MRTDTDRPPNLNTAGIASFRWRLATLWMILFLGGLAACSGRAPSAALTPTSPPLADELIFYNWADDMPQSILDAFTAEYGVKVTYQTYNSTREAMNSVESRFPM